MPIVIGGDAETYYDKEYSLKKMGNEEYILDPRFQVHGWSLSIDGTPSEFHTHRESARIFAGIDWDDVVFVGHNLQFDAAILWWRYGHRARMYADTLGIANAFIRPWTGRVDLAACAQHERLPAKLGTLPKTLGLSTDQIIAAGLWDEFAEYANRDNDDALAIFHKYYPQMLRDEKLKLDWCTRNYIVSKLKLDLVHLEKTLAEKEEERAQLLKEAGLTNPKYLRSGKAFAAHLEWLGVEVEYKNGKNDAEIPAIAKGDGFVQDLLNHHDPQVVKAMQARLAFSSSLDVTRCQRLIRMAKATQGKMLMPMRYHAAHTGRPGGSDGVNTTNLKRPNPKKGIRSPIREGIKAPPGMAMVEADASQIEARICVTLAGCEVLMGAFADPKRDPYCEFASEIFQRPITKADELERQVGKVGILSMQYGVGGPKTYRTLHGQGIPCEEWECTSYVDTYRAKYPEVLENGREFIDIFKWCILNNRCASHKGIDLHPDRLYLPTGRPIFYPQLRVDGRELVYYSPRYRNWAKLYPGSMNENLCQALANEIVGRVHAKFRADTVAMVYDSVVRLVPIDRAEAVGEETVAELRISPPWMPNLVLDAEYKIKTTL